MPQRRNASQRQQVREEITVSENSRAPSAKSRESVGGDDIPSLVASVLAVGDQTVLHAGAGIFSLTFLIYIATATHSIRGGNDGHLIAAVRNWAVPHAPGYPLWWILAKVYSLFPLSSIAFRLAAMNCVLQAATNVSVYASVYLWTHNLVVSVVAALAYAAVPMHWNLATSVNVWALNTFIIGIALTFTIAYTRVRRRPCADIVAVCVGLGLANDPSSILITGPCLAFVHSVADAKDKKKDGQVKAKENMTPAHLRLIAVSLSTYVIVPLLGASNPDLSWGNTNSVTGLIAHVTSYETGWLEASVPPNPLSVEVVGARVWAAIHCCSKEMGLHALLLGALGAYDGYRMRQTPGRLFPALYIGYLVVISVISPLATYDSAIGIMSRYWQVNHLLLAIWVGIGLNSLQRGRVLADSVLWTYFPLVILIITATMTGMRFSQVNHRNNTYLADAGTEALSRLPQDSVVVFDGGLARSTLNYLHEVQGVRPDVKLFDLRKASYGWFHTKPTTLELPHGNGVYYRPGQTSEKYANVLYAARHLIEVNRDAFKGRLFAWRIPDSDSSWQEMATLVPFCLVQRIDDHSLKTALADWEDLLGKPPQSPVPPPNKFDSRSYEHQLTNAHVAARQDLGMLLIAHSFENRLDQSTLKSGIAVLRPIVETILLKNNPPRDDMWALKNLALALTEINPPQIKTSISLYKKYGDWLYSQGDEKSIPELRDIDKRIKELIRRLPAEEDSEDAEN